MKYAVCGVNTEGSVKRLEKVLGVNAIKSELSDSHPIVDVAELTYRYDNEKNVVYDGCVIDYLNDKNPITESLFLTYEQIALCSLANLDRVFIVTNGLEDATWNYYAEMMPEKIKLIKDENEIRL